MKAISDNGNGNTSMFWVEVFNDIKDVFERGNILANEGYYLRYALDENINDCLYTYYKKTETGDELFVFLFKDDETSNYIKELGTDVDGFTEHMIIDFIYSMFIMEATGSKDPEFVRSKLEDCWKLDPVPNLKFAKE